MKLSGLQATPKQTRTVHRYALHLPSYPRLPTDEAHSDMTDALLSKIAVPSDIEPSSPAILRCGQRECRNPLSRIHNMMTGCAMSCSPHAHPQAPAAPANRYLCACALAWLR